MKYLKSYQLFESKTDQIREDIEDICLDFEDIDISYTIREINYYPDEDHPKVDSLIIEIQDKHQRFFRLEDIQDVFFRIKEYLRDKNFLIDFSIPKEDCYMSMDSFFREFAGEELYDLDIFVYYHHRIITESDDINQKIYHQVLDTIKDCFIEFEDNGWVWTKTLLDSKSISVWNFPSFNCRMMLKEDVYIPSGPATEFVDMTGEISSNGEITWRSQEMEFGDNPSIDVMTKKEAELERAEQEERRNKIKGEFDDFLVAVKRIQQETGLDFKFSYNNLGGEWRILIQGKI